MEYRPLPSDRLDDYRRHVQYAFQPERGPGLDGDGADGPGERRGLFDGDDLRCVCKQYWYRLRVRGEYRNVAGLSTVASPPEHRRRGNVARLLAASLAEYRERERLLGVLWPFDRSFYAKYGWATANEYVEYECPPDALAFARQAAAGRFRRTEADEYAALDGVLAAHAERFELAMDRTETWWRERIFDGWRSEPYVYAWEGDDETRGYVVYRIEDDGDGRRLSVAEFAHVDHEAYLNILRFLANHDSQVETVTLYGPRDTALLDLADDPGDIDCEVRQGPMVRIVDVPAAVESLTYPGVSGTFVLSVADSLADWNDDTFRIEVADGTATCEPTDDEPDVTTDVGTLSQVYVGYHGVPDAERVGNLEVRRSSARETIAAMYPPREVFVREFF